MKDIDLSLLRTFSILAETRSFTKTAKRVHRSQSAVSMQIAKLEEQLDCELFIRDKRNVSLTADGERLQEYAVQLGRLSNNLLRQFSKKHVTGEINFGAPEDFATYYLPEILSDFVKVNRGVLLNVNCNLTLNLIGQFEQGMHDLIVIKQQAGRLYANARPLISEKLVWVGNDEGIVEYDFKRVRQKYIEEHGFLPLALSPSPCVYRQQATNSLYKIDLDWKVVYTSPSYAGVIAAVKAGLGFTVLPVEMVPRELMIYDFKQGWPQLRPAEICLLARDETSPAVESLISFIFERIHVLHS